MPALRAVAAKPEVIDEVAVPWKLVEVITLLPIVIPEPVNI
jgi:hypothetical protein